jgi:hypothetical protein
VGSILPHRLAAVAIAAFAGLSGCMSPPPDLHVPEGAPLLFRAKVEGVVIYECQGVDPNVWTYRGTDATLFDERSRRIGVHDFYLARAAKASWALEDGSSVSGEITQKTMDQKDREIPSFLFAIRTHAGAGALSKVESIRQIEPKGGIPPTGICSPMNAILRVPFTAMLQFYGAGAPG